MGGIAYLDWRLALTLAASRHLAVFLHEMAHLATAVAVGRGKGALTARNVLFGGMRGAVYVPYAPSSFSAEISDALVRHAGWLFSAALAVCSSALLRADELRATLCDDDSHSQDSACCDEHLLPLLLATLQLALWWTAADACTSPRLPLIPRGIALRGPQLMTGANQHITSYVYGSRRAVPRCCVDILSPAQPYPPSCNLQSYLETYPSVCFERSRVRRVAVAGAREGASGGRRGGVLLRQLRADSL
jgi:hypothetical protein